MVKKQILRVLLLPVALMALLTMLGVASFVGTPTASAHAAKVRPAVKLKPFDFPGPVKFTQTTPDGAVTCNVYVYLTYTEYYDQYGNPDGYGVRAQSDTDCSGATVPSIDNAPFLFNGNTSNIIENDGESTQNNTTGFGAHPSYANWYPGQSYGAATNVHINTGHGELVFSS